MTNKKTKIAHMKHERIQLYCIVFVFIAALSFYAYFIMNSVVQTVLRKELVISIQETETHISELDAIYFKQTKSISRETAEDFGLIAISPQAYIEVLPHSAPRITRND